MTEYSACLAGYSLIIKSITSSLRNAVKPILDPPQKEGKENHLGLRENTHISKFVFPSDYI